MGPFAGICWDTAGHTLAITSAESFAVLRAAPPAAELQPSAGKLSGQARSSSAWQLALGLDTAQLLGSAQCSAMSIWDPWETLAAEEEAEAGEELEAAAVPGSRLAVVDAGKAAAQQQAAAKAVPPAMQVGNRRPSLAEAALAGRQAGTRRPSVAEAANDAGRTQTLPGAGTQGQGQPQQGRQHLTALLLLEGTAVLLVRANHDLLHVSLPSADVAVPGSAGTAQQARPQQMPADQRAPQGMTSAAFHLGSTHSPRSTDRPQQVAAFLTPPLQAAAEGAPRHCIYRGHKVSPTAAGCCAPCHIRSMLLPRRTQGLLSLSDLVVAPASRLSAVSRGL